MQNLIKLKSLIQDTLFYIENNEDELIESKNLFFKSPTQKNEKFLLENVIKKELPKEDTTKVDKQDSEITNPPVELIISPKEEKKEEKIELPPTEIITQTPSIEEDKKEIVPDKITLNILESKKIKRDDKPLIIEDNFSDIKNIITKISPNIQISDEILDDKLAKQKAQKYKLKSIAANLTILAYKENEKHYKFLEKLSLALNNYFYPSKLISAYVIEKENNWDIFFSENEIFLIISSDYTIFELPNLRKHYKENPSNKEKYLDNIPLFLLPDISIYLKEPSLKISLFKTLQQKIKNLKTHE